MLYKYLFSAEKTTYLKERKLLLKRRVIREQTEKAMAPHSSTLAWKIPWMEDPGGPQSMGLLRVRHD